MEPRIWRLTTCTDKRSVRKSRAKKMGCSKFSCLVQHDIMCAAYDCQQKGKGLKNKKVFLNTVSGYTLTVYYFCFVVSMLCCLLLVFPSVFVLAGSVSKLSARSFSIGGTHMLQRLQVSKLCLRLRNPVQDQHICPPGRGKAARVD